MSAMDERERMNRIAAAVAGDADALQQLIVGYHSALREFVAGRLDPVTRRQVDAEDVLQDAYASAFADVTRGSFETPQSFYKWLERIAGDKLKDRQRALRRRKRDVGRERHFSATDRSTEADLFGRLAAPDSTPSRKLARSEAVAAVLSSLARLTEDQRNVVRLRFLEHLSVADVAARLEKTEPAVHMLCHRGLKSLREFMTSISGFLTRG